MKKIKILMIISAVFLITGCNQTEQLENSGSRVTVKTPSSVSYPFKSIMGSNGSLLTKDSFGNESRFRYDLIIEQNGRRIAYERLKRNTERTLSLPSDTKFDIYVGLYYAQDSDTFNEEYNVYLASATKKDFSVESGETKTLNITLDLSKRTKITYRMIDDQYGSINTAMIRNAIMEGANPYFSVMRYGDVADKYNIVTFNGTTFSNINQNGYAVFKVKGDPDLKYNWLIGVDGIYRSSDMIFETSPDMTVKNTSYLKSVRRLLNFSVFSTENSYYYLMDYMSGFYAVNYNIFDADLGTFSNSWSSVAEINLDQFKDIFPAESFVLDMEQCSDLSDTGLSYIYLATKIGLFFVSSKTIGELSLGNSDKAIADFKKRIMILNEENKRSILITKVIDTPRRLYLGTRQGVYYIDKSSSSWNSFIDKSDDDFSIFPADKIKQLSKFDYNEIVTYMNEYSTSKGDILTIATPKRIFFINMGSGDTDYVSVFDGLPFIPEKRFSGKENVNTIDYRTHDAAKINSVVYDPGLRLFWICTDYGLSSIKLDDIL